MYILPFSRVLGSKTRMNTAEAYWARKGGTGDPSKWGAGFGIPGGLCASWGLQPRSIEYSPLCG